MAKIEETFNSTVGSLFNGMNSFLSTKSVVGEPIYVGDTVIIPLVNVSFGMGAGSFAGAKNNSGGGGIGGKMTPDAVLIIQDGRSRIIDIATNNGINKILDLVPDFVDRFVNKGKKNKAPESAVSEASSVMEETIMDASDIAVEDN